MPASVEQAEQERIGVEDRNGKDDPADPGGRGIQQPTSSKATAAQIGTWESYANEKVTFTGSLFQQLFRLSDLLLDLAGRLLGLAFLRQVPLVRGPSCFLFGFTLFLVKLTFNFVPGAGSHTSPPVETFSMNKSNI